VTREPEPFDSDPELKFKPSPEEFAAGAKAAYTRNAWRTHVRHGCTNYDELISTLRGTISIRCARSGTTR
jgi:hypothetical protein